jgi:hypothetical protein
MLSLVECQVLLSQLDSFVISVVMGLFRKCLLDIVRLVSYFFGTNVTAAYRADRHS